MQIDDQTFDLMIIGGGINGAGAAQDAALRGLKVLLIDKGDFCGGATSWSTRLVHGGLRYLEYGEFRLVRESLREREILLKIAPHLVRPLLLTIPLYADRSRPTWKVRAGMALYDLLSYDKTLPNHQMLSAKIFQQLFREVAAENIAGAAQYYDSQVAYAERLALENLLDAAAHGAVVCNYTEAIELHLSNHQITAITCLDHITGKRFICSINGLVVNTAGPWVDQVLQRGQQHGQPCSIGVEPKIGPTKGSHIVVAPFPGMPMDSALYVEAKSDGRPFFIVPWLGYVLIGTTDLRYQGDLDRIKASNDEIDYLIHETNLIIPTAQLSRQAVKFTYSGVRPLPYAEGKQPASITRSHILYDHSIDGVTNLISLIGGKITTYRQVGKEIADRVYQHRSQTPPPCQTQIQSLPGALLPQDDRITAMLAQYGDRLSYQTLHYLFGIYGVRTLDLLKLIDESPELAESITLGHPGIRAQIVFAVRSEYAKTLVDILYRRTMLVIATDYGLAILPMVVETLQKHCGWEQVQCDRAVKEFQTFMRDHCIPDYALDHYNWV
jgi:glycerol-3-phosphate dehydrogenase